MYIARHSRGNQQKCKMFHQFRKVVGTFTTTNSTFLYFLQYHYHPMSTTKPKSKTVLSHNTVRRLNCSNCRTQCGRADGVTSLQANTSYQLTRVCASNSTAQSVDKHKSRWLFSHIYIQAITYITQKVRQTECKIYVIYRQRIQILI